MINYFNNNNINNNTYISYTTLIIIRNEYTVKQIFSRFVITTFFSFVEST